MLKPNEGNSSVESSPLSLSEESVIEAKMELGNECSLSSNPHTLQTLENNTEEVTNHSIFEKDHYNMLLNENKSYAISNSNFTKTSKNSMTGIIINVSQSLPINNIQLTSSTTFKKIQSVPQKLTPMIEKENTSYSSLHESSLLMHDISNMQLELHTNKSKNKDFPVIDLSSKSTQAGKQMKLESRTHVCTYCEKQFLRLWDLKDHIRTHTGEKPFECPECHTSYATRSNLRAHQRKKNHHQWEWICTLCKKAFSQKGYMERHQSNACRKYHQMKKNQEKERKLE